MHIQTKRLELKSMGEKDLPALVELLTDEIVGKTYMVPEFESKAQAQALAERIAAMSREENRYVAGIFLDGRLIGMLNETERQEDTIEVGYAIDSRYHGRGYGTEALTGAIGFFHARGFREVVAGAFEGNAASLRIMEKSGMRRMEKTDTVTYRGTEHRCIYYSAGKE
jgi:RimJ/RimL family protein N-acetyltransferase